MEPILYLIPLFCLTAVIYSSVGFGGGSTYLAWLVLFGFPFESIPQMALICNLVVVGGGLYHYIRAGHLSLRPLLPFIVASMPLAYLGGFIPVPRTLFLILLSISLGAAGVRLLLTSPSPSRTGKQLSAKVIWGLGLPLGGGLGFLSGLVGIGGGIFLAPLLYFLGWGNARQIAAMASFFILVNSLFGLAGQFSKEGIGVEGGILLPLVLAVYAGGQIGSRISVGRISMVHLQRITALLILSVSVRILWELI